MHPLFETSAADIQALDDEQARELVARLCRAELRHRAIGTSPVTWGGDQRATDGGVDVRVDIDPNVGINGYIPRDSTAYQVKAEPFPPAKIPLEMAPKGALRPAIKEMAKLGGAYVIVSTRDKCSDSWLSKRLVAMADSLKTHGIASGSVDLDFFDSQRIADWANNFPGVLVWLRSILGKPHEGWRPYGAWAYRETSLEDDYLVDEKIKVFLPRTQASVSAEQAIDKIRSELSTGESAVRIVGLSGVGKTRLVQAVFDPRVKGSQPVPASENVVYTDLSDSPTPQPGAMVDALIQEGADCVVVVDNCGQDVHSKLAELALRPKSKVRLLTIEYDIRDDLPEQTECYRLEGSSPVVIEKLLKRRFAELSQLDIDKIVEFSEGNARVAFALASTSDSAGTLAQLKDSDLFDRLFIQKNIENDELKRCAESASLVYSFDGGDVADGSELANLASLAEVSTQKFFGYIEELHRRGLVQERGVWRAVLPHAISNRLAANALQSIPTAIILERLVGQSSPRIARSFSRRLGYLHDSEHAQRIVSDWLKPHGHIGDLEKMGLLQWEMLENIAPVNQRAALDAIVRGLSNPEFTTGLSSEKRRLLVSLLRSLAYEIANFDDSVEALLKIELAEPKEQKTATAREALQSLFYPYLSGTLATPSQRAAFIRALSLSADTRKAELALHLLQAALETFHFTSFHSFEFGALRRTYGWQPGNYDQTREWYALFIQVAVDIGKSSTPFASDARALLGRAFRGLWVDVQMIDELTKVASDLSAHGGWPEGWVGIKNTLSFDRERMGSASEEALERLELHIRPTDLKAKIRAKILSRGTFSDDLVDDFEEDDAEAACERAHQEAVNLGKEAALSADALSDLMPFVSSQTATEKIWLFGSGVGQASPEPEKILDRVRQILVEETSKDFEWQFVCGMIDGWNKVEPEKVAAFLDRAVKDTVWGPVFPVLQLSIALDDAAHARLLIALDEGRVPSRMFAALGSGRRTDRLTISQIAAILFRLAPRKDRGLSTAIDVLYMVIYGAASKGAQYKAELNEFCLSFISELDWQLVELENANALRHLEDVVESAVQARGPAEKFSTAINRLINFARSKDEIYPHRVGGLLAPFFKQYPVLALDEAYGEIDEAALVRVLTIPRSRNGESAVAAADEDELIRWCSVSPSDRTRFAARTCKLFEVADLGGAAEKPILGLASVAIRVLALAPDKKEVLDKFIGRFHPSSWSGSLSVILRERYQYLDAFNSNDDSKLKVLIDDAKSRLADIVETEEERELKQERRFTETFE
jgi:hypothetical protein